MQPLQSITVFTDLDQAFNEQPLYYVINTYFR